MSRTILKKKNKWQEAIEDAEKELVQVETRASQLKAAIGSFRANQKRGVPWPGESATQD